jgi:hypothetical protein
MYPYIMAQSNPFGFELPMQNFVRVPVMGPVNPTNQRENYLLASEINHRTNL